MSYRPQVKSDSNGTTQDLPLDAETVQGKTPVFTTTNQTISGVKTYNGNQIFKGYLDIRGTAAEKHLKTRGIGGSDGNGNESDLYLQYNSSYATKFGKTGNGSLNSDGTITEAGTLLSNKYAAKSHSHSEYVDLTNEQTITGYKIFTSIDVTTLKEGGTLLSSKYVNLANEQTISGTKSFTSGLKVSGRVANGGDDEGIVINTASNGYAGVCLGSSSGERSVFYFNNSHQAFWRYNNGTTTYDIHHPKKSGTIATTSDIPAENISTGILSVGSSISLKESGNYMWLVFPQSYNTNTFGFTADGSTKTGHQFAIVQRDQTPGCIRYFSSSTALTKVNAATITFSTQMYYIKFKIDG